MRTLGTEHVASYAVDRVCNIRPSVSRKVKKLTDYSSHVEVFDAGFTVDVSRVSGSLLAGGSDNL